MTGTGRGDRAFVIALALIGGVYVFLIVALVVAQAMYTTPGTVWESLGSGAVRYAIQLSLISSTLTAILSVWVAVPLGYLLSRSAFPGKRLLEAVIDIPIILPPLVIGLGLLILFQTAPGRLLQRIIPVTYEVPSVILAQFMVSCAFAARTMRVAFDEISPRSEQVAMTLGCTRAQAFWRVTLPEAGGGILAAATLAWARALGEFGPILVFSGATRMKTEVLSTTVFLELSIGNLEAAVAVSLLMVGMAVAVLIVARSFGAGGSLGRAVGA